MKSRCYQPYHDNLVALARINRKNSTPAECKMWSEILRRRQLTGFKFLRQKPIDGYIVDGCLPRELPLLDLTAVLCLNAQRSGRACQ